VSLPTRIPKAEPFAFTTFSGSKVLSRETALKKFGLTAQPVPWTYYSGEGAWAAYADQHRTYAASKVKPKGDDSVPSIIHGDCGGWHSKEDVRSATAIVLDYDAKASPFIEGEIEEFVEPFRDVRWLFQYRGGKFHWVFPLG
jgi:hypothetical protein